jgi:hypothetical protein
MHLSAWCTDGNWAVKCIKRKTCVQLLENARWVLSDWKCCIVLEMSSHCWVIENVVQSKFNGWKWTVLTEWLEMLYSPCSVAENEQSLLSDWKYCTVHVQWMEMNSAYWVTENVVQSIFNGWKWTVTAEWLKMLHSPCSMDGNEQCLLSDW